MKKRIIFASSATLLTLFATNPVSASENTTETPVVSTEETTIVSTTEAPTTVGATTEETTTMTPTTETATTEAVIEKPTEPTNVIKERENNHNSKPFCIGCVSKWKIKIRILHGCLSRYFHSGFSNDSRWGYIDDSNAKRNNVSNELHVRCT